MMPSLPSQDHVRACRHPVPTVGRQAPHCFPGSSIVPVPQCRGPPQRASPLPQIHHLTCCGAWALPELSCLLARWVSWGCGCRLLFKPQIPGAGRQSRQRRGWREGMQSPGPCSRGRHQQKATVSCVLPLHPATWLAAWEQPLGTPGLSGVLPPSLPALEREERCKQA